MASDQLKVSLVDIMPKSDGNPIYVSLEIKSIFSLICFVRFVMYTFIFLNYVYSLDLTPNNEVTLTMTITFITFCLFSGYCL